MKLGSLKSPHNRDGDLCVISRDLKTAVKATSIAPSLREAVEQWKDKEAALTFEVAMLKGADTVIAGHVWDDNTTVERVVGHALTWTKEE